MRNAKIDASGELARRFVGVMAGARLRTGDEAVATGMGRSGVTRNSYLTSVRQPIRLCAGAKRCARPIRR